MGRSAQRATQPVEQFFQFSLLGLLASGYCALAGSGALDLPTLIFTGAGLFLRLLLISGLVQFEIHPRWTAALTVLYIGFYPLDVMYVSQEFIPATVHLICFLAVARVMTATTNRDYFFVKLIAFLELLAATLLSDNLSFFVFLTLFMIFGVATFCCSEIRRSSQLSDVCVIGIPSFHGKLAGLTAGVTAGIIVLTGGLFFLLPRTARAAFRSLVSERYHLPGFSSEITLGQIGELKQQSTPVLHALIESPNDKLALKWRGSGLTQFDGKRWYNPPGQLEQIAARNGDMMITPAPQRNSGKVVSYKVHVSQIETDTLFLAGIPELIRVSGARTIVRGPGETYRTGFGSADGRTYWGVGNLPAPDAPPQIGIQPLPEQSFHEHLLLPGSTDSRILELARQAGTGSSALEQARSIERFLRTKYSYTTELLSEPVADPLAHFLFTRKEGHCEYFASAMAVMLRVVHIPSRVATGFQSGQYNPMTGLHVIRASDAHSWVEAWIPGKGWTTFDPTPPDSRQNQGFAAVWSQLLLYMDAADTFWRQWVVDYDIQRQISLVASVEHRTRRLNGNALLDSLKLSAQNAGAAAQLWGPWIMGAAALIVAGVFAGPHIWYALTHRRHSARIARGDAVASDAALLYNRMLAILRRRGVEKPAWLTPGEFARVVPPSDASLLVEQITLAYNDLRFGGNASAGPRMIRLLQELESCE